MSSYGLIFGYVTVPSADFVGTETAKPETSSAPYTDLVNTDLEEISFEKCNGNWKSDMYDDGNHNKNH